MKKTSIHLDLNPQTGGRIRTNCCGEGNLDLLSFVFLGVLCALCESIPVFRGDIYGYSR
jgi:hypothetical protein